MKIAKVYVSKYDLLSKLGLAGEAIIDFHEEDMGSVVFKVIMDDDTEFDGAVDFNTIYNLNNIRQTRMDLD